MDYKNGKIYKIVNDENDNFYIGSTCSTLVKRIYQHRMKHNKCMSKKIGVNLNDCIIVLVEKIECKDKQELHKRERYYIEKYKNEGLYIMNKMIPGRTHKEYYKDNKEETLRKHKEYRAKNKAKLKQHSREYNSKNKEAIKDHKKEYYEKNKSKINQKIKCVCGAIIQKSNTRHKKTKKHISYIENEK